MTCWYVLCGGVSLTPEDIERVRLEQASGRGLVIAVNKQIEHAPFANICFASDLPFWRAYFQDIRKNSPDCRLVSSSRSCINEFNGVIEVPPSKGTGFNREALTGSNSGHRATNLAYIEGMKMDPSGRFEIITLGLDCCHVDGKTHHYGSNPEGMGNAENPHLWAKEAVHLARGLMKAGIRVTNCSPLTALKCFQVMTLEEKLHL